MGSTLVLFYISNCCLGISFKCSTRTANPTCSNPGKSPFFKSMTAADFSVSVSDQTHLSHPGLQTYCRLCFFSAFFPTVTSQSPFSSPAGLSVLSLVCGNRHQSTSVLLPLCLDYGRSQLPSTLPSYSTQDQPASILGNS